MSSTALTQTSSTSAPTRQQSGQTPTQSTGAATTQGSQNNAVAKANTPNVGTPSAQLRTPQTQLQRSTSRVPTPGKWEHPRMQEILLRQRRTTFDQTNATRITRSFLGLVLVLFGPSIIADRFLPKAIVKAVPGQAIWISYLLELFLIANITMAMMPLLRKKDPIEDIPLTPRQRQLLDLPPMSRSATPQEQAAYVTPPRYSRNVTPSSMDSLLVNARGTPLSGRNSPLGSFTSNTASALGPRGSNGASLLGSGNRRTSDMSLRRESLGTPRSSPQAFNELESFGQTKSSRTSTGLNSKWLYDKGKDSPTSAAFLGTGWGTGSVFN